MKRKLALVLSAIIIISVLTACGNARSNDTPNPQISDGVTNINLTIGSAVFYVKLYDNETANALLGLFPLTLNMSELNGNEKFYYLPDSLPADSKEVGNISAGDLMLYGSTCLVLFYESFPTSYSYTRIGRVEDISGLAAALGSGSIEVTLALGS